jgi:hypothetical protein
MAVFRPDKWNCADSTSGIALDLYSGDYGFESRPRHRKFWFRDSFTVFFISALLFR